MSPYNHIPLWMGPRAPLLGRISSVDENRHRRLTWHPSITVGHRFDPLHQCTRVRLQERSSSAAQQRPALDIQEMLIKLIWKVRRDNKLLFQRICAQSKWNGNKCPIILIRTINMRLYCGHKRRSRGTDEYQAHTAILNAWPCHWPWPSPSLTFHSLLN